MSLYYQYHSLKNDSGYAGSTKEKFIFLMSYLRTMVSYGVILTEVKCWHLTEDGSI